MSPRCRLIQKAPTDHFKNFKQLEADKETSSMTDRESDQKEEADNDATRLSSDLEKLSLQAGKLNKTETYTTNQILSKITKFETFTEPLAAGVSTNEFYYSMDLQNIETNAEKLNSPKSGDQGASRLSHVFVL